MKSFGVWAPQINLKPDYWLGTFLVTLMLVAMLAAGICLIFEMLTLPMAVFLIVLLGTVTIHFTISSLLLMQPQSIKQIAWTDAGFEVCLQNGELQHGEVTGAVIIWSRIIFLNLACEREDLRIGKLRIKRQRSLMLRPQTIGEDSFRRLSVFLRLQLPRMKATA